MIYTVIPSQKGQFVSVSCTGDMTLSEVTTAWWEVQLVLAGLGWKRILVDVTSLQSGPDTPELFDLAKLFWHDFPKAGRMALVVRWDQSTLAKLLESLLRSVGIYLTVFVSEEMAEAWIAENSKEHQGSASDSLPKTAACSVLSKGSSLCHVS
jgi:hypothetical protein